MTRRSLQLAGIALVLALPGVAGAQETPRQEAVKPDAKPEPGKEQPKPEADRRGPHGQTLRVQLVITRSQGDKKLASLPYTLVVVTGSQRTRMRMGVDTPIPMSSPVEGGKPSSGIQYRTVGTNIDCGAWDRGEGRYQLSIGVENSSALPGATGNVESPFPLFRRFDTNVEAWLRDGQSTQMVASTDPVTGEVVKIDVTLDVVK